MKRIRPCDYQEFVEDLCVDDLDCICAYLGITEETQFANGEEYLDDECRPNHDLYPACQWLRKLFIGWGDAPPKLLKRAATRGGLKGYRFEIADGDDVLTAITRVSRFVAAPIEKTPPDGTGVTFTRAELRADCALCASIDTMTDVKIRVVAIANDGARIALCEIRNIGDVVD